MSDVLSPFAEPGAEPPYNMDLAYRKLRAFVAERVASLRGPLFQAHVPAGVLWEAFYFGLPGSVRPQYNCRACCRFLRDYGALLVIPEDPGQRPVSALWSNVPEGLLNGPFGPSLRRLRAVCEDAPVQGAFVSERSFWGDSALPFSPWKHLCGRPHSSLVWSSRTRSAKQRAAERNHEYEVLIQARSRYRERDVKAAAELLRRGLPDPNNLLPQAEWFAARYADDYHRLRLAAAKAPPGWSHVTSGLLSRLLEEVERGKGGSGGSPSLSLLRRWEQANDPLVYRRRTTAPSDGSIDRAEAIVAERGLERSLLRRFATLDDVAEKLWSPSSGPSGAGVFAGLRGGALPGPTAAPSVPGPTAAPSVPAVPMTWVRFRDSILPGARSLAAKVHGGGRDPFYAMTAAVDPAAPLLFQWGNSLSPYFRSPLGAPSQWGLRPGTWAKVTAVFRPPWEWGEGSPKKRVDSVFFALEGAADSGAPLGLGLFPTFFRSDLREIQKVLEAYSDQKAIDIQNGRGDAHGVCLQDVPGALPVVLRVDDGPVYLLDRVR